MPLDLVLMGPPGAGKGTQAARLARERGLAHIATGDMLRAAVRDGTPLGLEAKAIMARGDLVPDALIIDMFRERLEADDTASGILVDGFPRTGPQAQALDEMLAGLDRRLAGVVVFEIELDALVRRLSGRRVCRANEHVYHVDFNPPKVEGVCDIDGSKLYQRDDDREDVIRVRYEKQWVDAAAPVLAYYESGGLVARVDAGETQDRVAAAVDAVIDRLDGRA
ncbi:MAG TPA: adenylate kinase [Gaiellales bacterium]|jgi:adenylate kinase|nr:adenylate kinase [Gaiellales bacterium]